MSDKPKILFVDDEQRVLNAMRGLFRREFELFLATEGAEAIRLVGEHAIDVLVADQRMPGMTGVEVLQQVKKSSPATVRILLTGYADLDAIEASINCGEVFRFLSKPCPPDELRATLLQAIETARASATAAVSEAAASAIPELAADIAVPELPQFDDPAPHTTTVVPFPSTGETGNNAIVSDDEDTSVNEVILAGDAVSYKGGEAVRPSDSAPVGVAVYTIDPAFAETAARTLQTQREASIATNLIAVTKILEEQRAGVLLTDLSDNIALLRSMIGTLKKQLPELVTIVASENRDASAMIALINHGQVFRYIKKPLDTETLLTDVNAAVIKHQQLLQHPELLQRHAVADDTESTSHTPKLIQFVDHLSRIRKPWRRSGS